jgi:hypothetical protein
MESSTSFARRLNHDATFDSICTRCYQTIASADSESLLLFFEQAHECDHNGRHNQTAASSLRSGYQD